MIDQELIDKVEYAIGLGIEIDRVLVKELLISQKQLIEGNANLHREKMMLQNAMEQIANSDPGESGNIARKIMASYGFDPKQN